MTAAPHPKDAVAASAPMPTCGFIGWGPESAAMLGVLRARDAAVDAVALAPAGGAPAVASAPRPMPTLEGLFQVAQLVFAEGGMHALEPHLPVIRLAISDRHALLLLGPDWSLDVLLGPLKERKLARCALLPGGPGTLGTLAYFLSPYFSAAERAELRALFAHLELCVELREERHFEVLQGLSEFAPAAFYTAMEALADGVATTGFSRAAAQQVLASLLHTAARRVLDGASPAQLREQALEGGVAAAGLLELESAGFRGALMRAVQQAMRGPRRPPHPSHSEQD